jgi:hypothetical protein
MYRTNGSRAAGPSEPRRGLELDPDERSPPDLGDVGYEHEQDPEDRPPADYMPKYPNALTMTPKERLATTEVQELIDLVKLSYDMMK